VIKACLDGLNGVAYLDDSQVSGLRWTRVYAIEEEQPGIYLELYTVE
jgi:Holliday junction resolvase RusA-like endonuclease